MTQQTGTAFSTDEIAAIFQAADIALWHVDLLSRTLACAPLFTRLTGVPDGAPSPDFHDSLAAAGDAARLRKLFEDCANGNAAQYAATFQLRTREGDSRWAEIAAAVTGRNADGKPSRLSGMLRDVTTTEKAFRGLEKFRITARALFEKSPHVSLLFGADGELKDCNPVAANVFGEPSREELLRNFREKSSQWFLEGNGAVRVADAVRLTLKEGYREYETELALPQGRTAFEVICKRIPWRDSRAVVMYLTDLTRIRAAQRELRKERDLLHAINEIATCLVAADTDTFEEEIHKAMGMIARAADVDRLRIWRNYREADGSMYALEVYQWVKSPRWKTTEVFKSRESVIPYWWKIMKNRKAFNARVDNVPPAERKMLEENKVLSIVAIPIFIRDEYWGFIGFDDCTHSRTFSLSEEKLLQSGGNIIVSAILRNEMTASLIKAREAALASARAKTDFLSRMSHEIRTPMNAIIGMSVIAEKSGNVQKMTECLHKIDASSRLLLGIINDVLDMSKIEADKFQIHASEFDFEAMLRDVVTIMQTRFDEKGQSFRRDMCAAFPRRMVGDDLRLSQVILNLLSNAVKFTAESGSITMSVREITTGEDTSILRVEVADNGIGIPRENLLKIFQSFEQADGSITRRFGGTGLGLAISQKIITLMDGCIWAESEPGKGSTFVFEVPVRWGGPVGAEADSAPETAPPPEKGEGHDWRGKRILLAEDIAINREIVLGILEETGVAIDIACNGKEALDLMADCPGKYDVILMDVQMPILDGISATRHIRELCSPAARTVPIIAMTANAFKEDEAACLMAGMDGYIAKPIDVEKLFAILTRLFAVPAQEQQPEGP